MLFIYSIGKCIPFLELCSSPGMSVKNISDEIVCWIVADGVKNSIKSAIAQSNSFPPTIYQWRK